MTDCTVLVCADALAMSAPFAGAADAPDDASVPTPAATMKAARITRISILLCTTEPFGRAHHKQGPAACQCTASDSAERMAGMACPPRANVFG
jgi:hypothetical protein